MKVDQQSKVHEGEHSNTIIACGAMRDLGHYLTLGSPLTLLPVHIREGHIEIHVVASLSRAY